MSAGGARRGSQSEKGAGGAGRTRERGARGRDKGGPLRACGEALHRVVAEVYEDALLLGDACPRRVQVAQSERCEQDVHDEHLDDEAGLARQAHLALHARGEQQARGLPRHAPQPSLRDEDDVAAALASDADELVVFH